MAENDPLADIFTLFAAPIVGTMRSVEQFRTGVDEFLKGVENFNRTMANLNETTERINLLLADVEEPIRAAVPQFTRSVKAADDLMKVVSGPAMAAAPAFSQIADTIATPAFQQLPERVNQFNEMMIEMSRRLGPLTQLAETAGGLFGGFRFPGVSAPAAWTAAQTDDEDEDDRFDEVDSDEADGDQMADDDADGGQEPDQPTAPAAKKATAKKSPAKKKKPAVKRQEPKKPAKTQPNTAAKKTGAKKTGTKKTGAKQRSGTTKPSSSTVPTDDYLA